MKVIKSLFTILSILAFTSTVFAKNDPVEVDGPVKFSKIAQNQIALSAGDWTRAVVWLKGIENQDDKANNANFIRDVDVTLTVLYRDEMAKDKKSAESLIAFKGKARLFAIKRNEKTPVVFYLPFEASRVYRIDKEPFAYSVELSVGGVPVELSKQNVKNMLSKRILKGSDPKKNYENYQKLVSKAAAANENVFMNLLQAPLNVQYYEYYTNPSQCRYIPTYIQTK